MARMNLNPYKYTGKNLTQFQKSYNKAVSLAWRRIKYMNKKYGISATLPSVPPTTDDEEIEKAIARLEYIRTDVQSDPKKRKEYVDRFIQEFIDEITDYLKYVDTSSKYESVHRFNEDKAYKWSNRISTAIQLERARMGDIEFYNRVLQTDVKTKLSDIAQAIYSLPSDDAAESAATALFNKFLDTIRENTPLDALEIKMYSPPTSEEYYDSYQNALDIESWELHAANELLGAEE